MNVAYMVSLDRHLLAHVRGWREIPETGNDLFQLCRAEPMPPQLVGDAAAPVFLTWFSARGWIHPGAAPDMQRRLPFTVESGRCSLRLKPLRITGSAHTPETAGRAAAAVPGAGDGWPVSAFTGHMETEDLTMHSCRMAWLMCASNQR
jgi:hypothetical protein